MTTPKLTVLSREYCHLCEDMVAALRQFQGRYAFEIEVVDVDRDPRLEEKWGDKVPVLLDGERELCHYFLDVAVLDARLARMK
ncbi:MAG: glutaredoxin family protein [Usitatibacter sp.]